MPLFKKKLFINWRIIALQNFVAFCQTSAWISHESESCSVMSDSLLPHGLYSPWNSPGQNTGVGSLSPLQGIFPTQRSYPGLPHCRQILYQLSHKGSPRILEWVAYPFSSGSSPPRNWTGLSFIAGRFLTSWAKRDAQSHSVVSNSFLPHGLYVVHQAPLSMGLSRPEYWNG